MKDEKLSKLWKICERIEKRQFAKECRNAQNKVLDGTLKAFELRNKESHDTRNHALSPIEAYFLWEHDTLDKLMDAETFRKLHEQHTV